MAYKLHSTSTNDTDKSLETILNALKVCTNLQKKYQFDRYTYAPSYVQFASNFECFLEVNFGTCYLASWSLNQFTCATV